MSADYVIPPAPQAAIAVAGSRQGLSGPPYLVRRPQLHRAHSRDGTGRARCRRSYFAKPADAIVADGGTVPYPSLTKDMHHEVELVVALKSGGRNIPVAKANDCIYGYAVGIDLTRRDLQIASRDLKRPWEVGKAFDHSAPCGAIKPASEIGHPTKGKITLKCNGKIRQDGDLNQLIWNVPEIISNLSEMVDAGGRRHHHDRHAVGRRRHRRRRQARMRGRGRRQAHCHHRTAAEVAFRLV